jgi:hypothetical protein
MGWAPSVGELLPRAEEATGIRRKLSAYCLDPLHESGGAKALGFSKTLGITIESIDYLENRIRCGILMHPVSAARPGAIRGVICVVEFPLRGIGARGHRVVPLRTVWEVPDEVSPPRLVTAFLKP